MIIVSVVLVENQVFYHATTQVVRMTKAPLGCDIRSRTCYVLNTHQVSDVECMEIQTE